jgi:hypothetical protein
VTDPRSQLLTFPLNLGVDNVSHPEAVQPVGQRPRLIRSMNTRLSKLPGCVSKAPGSTSLATFTATTMGGVIPAGLADSTLLPENAAEPAQRRVVGSAVGTAANYTDATVPQNVHYPAQVSRAGMLTGSNATRYSPSCAYQSSTGWTYFVTIRRSEQLTGVFLNVVGDDGQEILSSTLLQRFTTYFDSERNFAAVSVHGSSVVFWYAEGNTTQLMACSLTVNASTLTVTLGTPVVVHTVVGTVIQGPDHIQLSYDDLDTANVYVAIDSGVGVNRFDVLRVTVATLAVAATFTSAVIAPSRIAICYRSGIGLLVAANAVAGQIHEYELNATTLVQSWTVAGALDSGIPSCGWETYNGTQRRVFASSRVEATFDGTLVEWRNSLGALDMEGVIKHQTMVGQTVTMRSPHSASELYCLFTTQVCYRPDLPIDSYDVDSDYFVPDPSIEVFRMSPSSLDGTFYLTPHCMARLGTDLVIRYPGSLNPLDESGVNPNTQFVSAPSNCIPVGTGRALIGYLQENVIEGDVAMGYAVRFAELDFNALQPRFAHTSDGATIVAGACPVVWDGSSITEYSPLRQPSVTGTTAGGTGPAFPAGSYLAAALITWVDAQGQVHRSAPSNIITLTDAAPFSPTVTVTLPATYRNELSQPGVQVVLYVSEVDSTTLYANPSWLPLAETTSFDTVSITISNIELPVADAFHPAIYTDGGPTQQLAAYCPNACLDVAIIADRPWMLDAERPSRWWYGKPKVAGVFAEMSPDQYLETPSNAGRGVALSEWQGNPLFLTSKGVWTCAGEGPDALLQPPFFSAAVQVSDVACSQRLSVVRSPVGVLFVSNNRFVRFNGQLIEYPEVNATLYGDVVGTAVFRDQQEVVFFTEQAYAYVYNWKADAFTVWEPAALGLSSLTGAAQRSDGKVLLVNGGAVWLLDPETVSATAQISIYTGHVQLGDKQDNNMLQNFILHAQRGGPHALAIFMGRDYDVPTELKGRTVAQIVDSENSSFVYDVAGEPGEQCARAVQFGFEEFDATSEGFQPLTCTLEVIKKPGWLRRSLPESSRV